MQHFPRQNGRGRGLVLGLGQESGLVPAPAAGYLSQFLAISCNAFDYSASKDASASYLSLQILIRHWLAHFIPGQRQADIDDLLTAEQERIGLESDVAIARILRVDRRLDRPTIGTRFAH